jgi:hydroxypyruvate isomerase
MKLAANLTMLFNEVPTSSTASKRPRRPASRAWNSSSPMPFRRQAARREARCATAGTGAAQPAGRRLGGGRARHRLPSRAGRRIPHGVAIAIAYAQALGCQAAELPGRHRAARRAADSAQDVLVANLALPAAPEGCRHRLLIEPINTFDIPGFFLHQQARRSTSSRTGSDNLFIQYDIYHMQRMEGELAATIKANLAADRHTCSWPTTLAATSRAPARSITASCSRRWTASAMTAGSAANTSRAPRHPKAWAGCRAVTRRH